MFVRSGDGRVMKTSNNRQTQTNRRTIDARGDDIVLVRCTVMIWEWEFSWMVSINHCVVALVENTA